MRNLIVLRKEQKLTSLLATACEENVILTALDGREFLLAEIDSMDREVELLRQNDEFMHLLDARALEPATVPLDQARQQLGLS